MRLAYLSVPVLGFLLVGCGPDEEREREAVPAPAPAEQPAAPATGNTTSEPGPTSGASVTSGEGTALGGPNDPAGDVETAPGDNGSGLGTASGAGKVPNPTGTGSGAAQ